MPVRKVPLVSGNTYHIFTKTIAGFKVFNHSGEYRRMVDTVAYYSIAENRCKFSLFNKSNGKMPFHNGHSKKIVRILAYCLMPTHIHLVLQQKVDDGIGTFMGLVLKSYSKYFNLKYKRKGPLWEGRFKNVLVGTDQQLLHLTRYIHLNPVTAYLVDSPDEWLFSSFKEFVSSGDPFKRICEFNDMLEIEPESYRIFVNDNISYQRELAGIKELFLE